MRQGAAAGPGRGWARTPAVHRSPGRMTKLAGLEVTTDTAPMEARTAAALPTDAGWQFEPKWDGFRCLAFKAGATVELKAKSGKSLSRYFPEVTARLAAHGAERFVLDGELMIQVGAAFSSEALQMRLHPAESRVRRL